MLRPLLGLRSSRFERLKHILLFHLTTALLASLGSVHSSVHRHSVHVSSSTSLTIGDVQATPSSIWGPRCQLLRVFRRLGGLLIVAIGLGAHNGADAFSGAPGADVEFVSGSAQVKLRTHEDVSSFGRPGSPANSAATVWSPI
eukprot:4922045-Alexandrium_andersonii.AAC.1